MLQAVRRSLFLILFPAALFVAACSSGSPSTTTPPPSTQPPSSPPQTSPSEATPPPGDTVELILADFEFQPKDPVASNTQSLKLTNTGAALHNLTIAGTPVDQDVPPGETITLDPPGDAIPPGTYQISCKYHRTLGMVGTLTVVS
jgi:cupredoxin-like protein